MVYSGYLRMGGNEVINSPRAEGITRSYDCYVPWIEGDSCTALRDALGDESYSYANIAAAPWYDPSNPEISSRVLGIYGLGFTGVKDSTRQVQVTEGLDDGGVIGSIRKGVRQVRARVGIIAIGEDAMEYARTWLEATLDPNACGQHAEECGTTDVEYLAACPPERAMIPYLSEWALQATNLLTNPSFEAAGSTVVVQSNLFTNPDFETGSGTVVVRTNLCVNPSFETNAGSWSINNGATATRVTSQFHRGTASLQVVTPGTVPAEGVYSTPIANQIPAAGAAFSISMWVLAPVGAKMRMVAASTGAGPTSVTTDFTGTGAWQFVTANGAVAGDGRNPYAVIYTSNAAGQAAQAITYYVDEVMIELTPTVGPYFDGGVQATPDADLSTRWTGTANASTSELYGTGIAGWTGSVSNRLAIVQSTRYTKGGTKSARLIPLPGATGDEYAQFDIPVGVGRSGGTVLASRYQEAAITIPGGTFAARALRPVIYTPETIAPGLVNGPGWQDMRVTYPALTSVYQVRLYHGGLFGSGDVWYDMAALVPGGGYAGPYFDGSTQPILRKNLVTIPRATAGWAAVAPGAGGAVTTSLVADARFAGGNARRGDWTTAATGAGWLNMPGIYTFQTGETWVFAMRYAMSGNSATPVVTIGGGSPPSSTQVRGTVDHGDGTFTAWTVATFTSAGSGPIILGSWGTMANGAWLLAGNALVENATAFAPYFDGGSGAPQGFTSGWTGAANASPSIMWDADFSVRWQGTAGASVSELTGVAPAGLASTVGVVAVQSVRWNVQGTYSLRLIPTSGTVNTSYATIPIPAPAAAGGGTAMVTHHQEGPITGSNWSGRGRPYTSAAQYLGPQAPNAAGQTSFQGPFTGPSTAFVLPHGGLAGSGDVWYDMAVIVADPAYTGPAFTGATPDDPTVPPLYRYEWTGAADASTSTYETREWRERPQTDEEYAAVVDPLRRYLHGVAATSGPTTISQYHRDRGVGGDIVGQVVEFTLTATRPWVYGITKQVDLPSTTPFVVEDVQFNLVPYPSMQLAGPTQVVSATNLSTNPSVEVDATGWVFNQATPITAGMLAGVRSTELAAVGLASYKVTFTASAGGTGGWFSAEQVVALPASPPAGARYSISMWGAAIVTTGTPVVTNIQHIAEWLNASNTVLRTDVIGTVTPTGGASSLAQIAPPAGATQVRVSARCNMTSFASGNVVRLFADALTVSTP